MPPRPLMSSAQSCIRRRALMFPARGRCRLCFPRKAPHSRQHMARIHGRGCEETFEGFHLQASLFELSNLTAAVAAIRNKCSHRSAFSLLYIPTGSRSSSRCLENQTVSKFFYIKASAVAILSAQNKHRIEGLLRWLALFLCSICFTRRV